MKKSTIKRGVGLALMVGGAFALQSAQAAFFDFVDGGEFDNQGTNVSMTVDGFTMTTFDIIGWDGTLASTGTVNKTNIQSVNSLGINSADNGGYSNESRDFNPGEGWVIFFDKDVYMTEVDFAGVAVDTEMTISSSAFSDFVLLGEGDDNTGGTWDLSNTFVAAGTHITFQMTSTDLASDTGMRIDDFTVIPEPATLGLMGVCAIGAFMFRRFRI